MGLIIDNPQIKTKCQIFTPNDIVEKMLEREPLPAPKLVINKDIKNFYDFTVDDFDLVGYEHGGSVGKIPVAI